MIGFSGKRRRRRIVYRPIRSGVALTQARAAAEQGGLGATLRRDAWWLELLPVLAVLSLFGLYATFRAFEGKFYEWGPYLSPFYSPLIDPGHRVWPFSPALLILGGPLGFRATCYYYRKAYYRAFFLDPPACAVGESRRALPRRDRVPLHPPERPPLLPLPRASLHSLSRLRRGQGVPLRRALRHRRGLARADGQRRAPRLYTFSCHSLRHLVGGKLDCFSCSAFGPVRGKTWRGVTFLNERHMLFAWMSLFSVGLADLYVRLLATRRHRRPAAAVTEKYETHEHDVLVIGAGGAGLRAAIEASPTGVRRRRLQVAARQGAHGDGRGRHRRRARQRRCVGRLADALPRHDAGGKFLNNWRMAQLHAQESRDRVHELEQWGALFDRTRDGRILQRAFGGHTFSGSATSATAPASR